MIDCDDISENSVMQLAAGTLWKKERNRNGSYQYKFF